MVPGDGIPSPGAAHLRLSPRLARLRLENTSPRRSLPLIGRPSGVLPLAYGSRKRSLPPGRIVGVGRPTRGVGAGPGTTQPRRNPLLRCCRLRLSPRLARLRLEKASPRRSLPPIAAPRAAPARKYLAEAEPPAYRTPSRSPTALGSGASLRAARVLRPLPS